MMNQLVNSKFFGNLKIRKERQDQKKKIEKLIMSDVAEITQIMPDMNVRLRRPTMVDCMEK